MVEPPDTGATARSVPPPGSVLRTAAAPVAPAHRPRHRSLGATAVVALVMAVVAGIVVLIATGGSGSESFAAKARSICAAEQRSLKSLPTHPTSITAALQLQHAMLNAARKAVTRLGPLRPPTKVAGPFRAGLADDRTLLAMLSSLIARPDYARLAITLPRDPALAPTWLKAWLSRSQLLIADAHRQFRLVGIQSCDTSLG